MKGHISKKWWQFWKSSPIRNRDGENDIQSMPQKESRLITGEIIDLLNLLLPRKLYKAIKNSLAFNPALTLSACLAVINDLSLTNTFHLSSNISQRAILFIEALPSFLTVCSTFLNGVNINQYLFTLA